MTSEWRQPSLSIILQPTKKTTDGPKHHRPNFSGITTGTWEKFESMSRALAFSMILGLMRIVQAVNRSKSCYKSYAISKMPLVSFLGAPIGSSHDIDAPLRLTFRYSLWASNEGIWNPIGDMLRCIYSFHK
jgi:hypothetical protein